MNRDSDRVPPGGASPASGILAATAPTSSITVLAVALLLLLGLGWSAAFVASSTLLARIGTRTQGRADGVG